MDENQKKKVDQDWKDQIEREHAKAREDSATYHKPSFSVFLSSLGIQAMIAMGKMENPVSYVTENHFLKGICQAMQVHSKKKMRSPSGDLIASLPFSGTCLHCRKAMRPTIPTLLQSKFSLGVLKRGHCL